LAKNGVVSGRVILSRVVRTLQNESHDVCKGNSGNPPHLAKENHHFSECLGSRLWVKGHYQGLRVLSVLEAIFKGLLILQETNLTPGCVGPVIE